ncbi:MAG: hypothetical protein LBI92_07415 [Azoarcus sp.]|jgi:hypothetical protein|nr:hypothetical protein [Azoarcus sp.]
MDQERELSLSYISARLKSIQQGTSAERQAHLPLLATGLAVAITLRLCVLMDTRSRLRRALCSTEEIPHKLDGLAKAPVGKYGEVDPARVIAAAQAMRAKLHVMIGNIDANIARLTADAKTLSGTLTRLPRLKAESSGRPGTQEMAIALLNATIEAANDESEQEIITIAPETSALLEHIAASARRTSALVGSIQKKAALPFGRAPGDTRLETMRFPAAETKTEAKTEAKAETDPDTLAMTNLRRMLAQLRSGLSGGLH